MNKKQYNNIIEHTLKYELSGQTEDFLEVARAVFNNMGIALPQGDIKHVYEVIKTDDYMGWKTCTMQEAQQAADNGTAAIGISEDRIVVLAANDEEEPVVETTEVMTLSEKTSAYAVVGMSYATYSNGATAGTLGIYNKSYDPNYPYTMNGIPNNLSEAQYYALLDSYSYELRNDIQFYFTFEEIDSLRAYMSSSLYTASTEQERKQVIEDIKALAQEAIEQLASGWAATILDTISIVSTISSLNSKTVKEELDDIIHCIDYFSHIRQDDSSIPKPNVVYRISLLKQSPVEGRQIKIESSDGLKEIYTIHNGTYESTLMLAMANAHSQTLYKIAPEWSYYWE